MRKNILKYGFYIFIAIIIISCKSPKPIINLETQQLAINGNPDAQIEMGKIYFKSRNDTETFNWMDKAAKQGHIKAIYFLSILNSENGYECPTDCLQKVAEQGVADAQYSLGGSYLDDLRHSKRFSFSI